MRRESTGNFDPKPGNEYVIVNITVETDSQEKEPVSSLMQFELADTSGQKFDESLFAKVNGQLDGDVTAGAPFTGEIAYEVPQGAKGLQLLFSGLLSENKLAFDLGE